MKNMYLGKRFKEKNYLKAKKSRSEGKQLGDQSENKLENSLSTST